jgi:hypothetical protein
VLAAVSEDEDESPDDDAGEGKSEPSESDMSVVSAGCSSSAVEDGEMNLEAFAGSVWGRVMS